MKYKPCILAVNDEVFRLEIDKKMDLIESALKDYFSIFLNENLNKDYKFYNFPSLVADDLWHTFILFTRNNDFYSTNCFHCSFKEINFARPISTKA